VKHVPLCPAKTVLLCHHTTNKTEIIVRQLLKTLDQQFGLQIFVDIIYFIYYNKQNDGNVNDEQSLGFGKERQNLSQTGQKFNKLRKNSNDNSERSERGIYCDL